MLPNPSLAVGHFSSTDGPAWYFDANELPRFHPGSSAVVAGASPALKRNSFLNFSSKSQFSQSPASPASESHSRSLCGLQPAQPLFILCDAPAAPRRFSRRCSRRYSRRGSRRFSRRFSRRRSRRFYRLRPSCAPLPGFYFPHISHFTFPSWGHSSLFQSSLRALSQSHSRSSQQCSPPFRHATFNP